MDRVDKIMAYEGGDMSGTEVCEFFQEMINDGLVWQLQGSYGRAAHHLITSGGCTAAPRFSVQRHHARSLHYDFRLEHGGVLVSWAVPKGLPDKPKENRLGVHVADHELSYIDFDGEIPEGEYGAGRVELVDIGWFELIKWSDKHIKVTLHGKEFNGTWSLRNTKGKNWIIRVSKP